MFPSQQDSLDTTGNAGHDPTNAAGPVPAEGAEKMPATSMAETEERIRRAVDDADKHGDDTPMPEGAGVVYNPDWQDSIAD